MPAMASITVRGTASEWQKLQRFAEDFADRHGLPGGERGRLLIALEELLTNLVKFGYDPGAPVGSAEVALSIAGDLLIIVFADDGRAFNPLAAPPPSFEGGTEGRPIGGLGIHMLRAFATTADYARQGGRNRLTLTHRLPPSG
jgi:anti-sigma regulatory factor (Ser/Thr protein kinase)